MIIKKKLASRGLAPFSLTDKKFLLHIGVTECICTRCGVKLNILER